MADSPAFRIVETIPPDGIATAARLFWQAFRGKLGKVMGPDEKGVAFVERVLDPVHGIAALDARDHVIGIAGFKTAQGALVGGALNDLRQVYGTWSLIWRLPFLALLERQAAEDELLMDGIVVDSSARGQGVGTALLTAIKDRARALGKQTIRLDVIDTNPRARALYERQGFEAGKTEHIGPLLCVFGFSAATTMRFYLPEIEQNQPEEPHAGPNPASPQGD